MTINDKAKQLVSDIRLMNEADAIEYLRVHLALVRIEGERSGIEQARQAINQVGQVEAA